MAALQRNARVLSIWLFGLLAGFMASLLFGGYWPNVPLHAVSTDRVESMAIATGYCDESIEAVYFLDFLTGELSATVVAKQTGKFNAFYNRNVAVDLGVTGGHNPRYVMSTGMADLRRTGGHGVAPSRSLLYIAEATTGKVAAYAVPWSSSAWTTGQRASGELMLLDMARIRAAGSAQTSAGQ